MTRQKIILSPPSSNRRQPLLENQSPSGSLRFAEVAGGTTAECAAICCCCPCGLVNLLLLAVYKLPAGLCRRAMRKKRRQRRVRNSSEVFPERQTCKCGCLETEMVQIEPVENVVVDALVDKEVMDLEKEMWERFYSTGFWRSPSQRE